MKIKVIGVVVFSVLALEGVASAQTPTKKMQAQSSVEVMEVDDDKLLTVAPAPNGFDVNAGHVRKISILVRPRVTFAPEMLKSIENI